ncbi:PREDICTED: putative RNA exonuclease NEF-sp [Trachymyrmex cornetzi]|uniref:putative RNA exonuclease NEF-sp n=1 Tax=Trachymyrmex cornetzi TaxID=471704 RepID=UPI00084F56DA|nr:PREDICTED: putative RNA exonuclease NEF-sp [Trachymyrmex cornetzi]XP_018362664.1 PREDICTED: putative RNA exonuclease NEF-sp [Trachymyrmex cornetzi]XP_018362665.1 PREDICTED: putative RNA exonuclease NEF-sp [Trachymyrmex cornetzi]
MKERTTKQLQRLEKKKAKMAAFLEIARLNDKDKEAKLQVVKQTIAFVDGFNNSNDKNNTAGDNSRKRTCEKSSENICLEACKEENADGPELQDNTKKPRLSDSQYASLKEELRKRKKRLQAIPRLTLKAVGENATLDVGNLGKRIPLFLSDIQHLLLYSLLGHHSPYLPARWCKLEKYNKISHTVVIVLEGLSSYHFMAYESMFPHIVHNLKHRLEVITPAVYGASITEELAAVPLTGTQSDKLIKRYGSLETALQTNGNVIKLLRSVFPMHLIKKDVKFSTKNLNENLPPTDKFCRTKLLLSLWQMVEENYPVPLKGTLAERYGSYILTKDVYEEATSTSPMFGLDCEMCLTTSNILELTRISIVDEDMNVIYDSLVKPENVITDYLTRYSGITENMLDDVTITLHDVQQTIRALLPPNAILVGQSLNSDLHTLKMMHPYIIDTSVIFNLTGDRYRKTKLQILAREFLGESIQDDKAGHCSTEDSKASMKLVKLKLANSVNYGDAVLLGDRNMRILKMETNNEMTKRELQKTEIKKYATSIFSHITKNKGTTAAIVGNDEVISEYSKYLTNSSLNVMDDESFAKDDQVRLVIADNNKHAVDRSSEIAMEHAFVLCHVKLKEEQLKDEQLEETFRTVNKWIHKVWQYSAINSLACVIFSGQNNTANGSCFLNIKTEISSDIVIRA